MKILVVICFCIPAVSNGQLDTAKIKSWIPETEEYYNHKQFWKRIHDRDQELRKSPNIETIDEENLIAVIYYFNKFGYPDIDRLGSDAKIVPGVWGHNRYTKIDHYTYPLILAGYNSEAISEPAYREFYLRYIYQLHYDGNIYKTDDIQELHSLLNLHESSYLSVDTVLSLLIEFKDIRGDSNVILGRWLTIASIDTFYYEGIPLVSKHESQKVILYETSESKYYLAKESSDNAIEPTEVVPLNRENTQFGIYGKESSKYYFITENKDLVYTDSTGKIYKSYTACR